MWKIFFKSTLAAVAFAFVFSMSSVLAEVFFFLFLSKLEFQQFTAVELQPISMCANNLLLKKKEKPFSTSQPIAVNCFI